MSPNPNNGLEIVNAAICTALGLTILLLSPGIVFAIEAEILFFRLFHFGPPSVTVLLVLVVAVGFSSDAVIMLTTAFNIFIHLNCVSRWQMRMQLEW
jgi:hypothetical protein